MTDTRTNQSSYGATAKSLHWITFLLIGVIIPLGFIMTEPPLTPDKFTLYKWHKTLGALVLLLASIRLGWRLINPPPPLPRDTLWYERIGAHGVHFLLYTCLFVMPLSGWLMTSASGFPNILLGDIQLAPLIDKDEDLYNLFRDVHHTTATVLLVLVGTHVSAAFFHYFIRRDEILGRMIPFLNRRT